ncbi:MAG: protein kinase, partial [Planctomycetia bacterium]|nr:protein kinase [Planctomycetia bacterium]
MTQSPPDAETLRKFAIGDLPPAEWDRVARYLEANPQSPETLVEPAVEDTFVSALRAAPADAPADSPELKSIIDAAAKLVPDAATAVFAQSVSIPFEPTAEYVVPPKPGERLGRFRIERMLGRGGMGVVYAAADEQLDRRIALKVMAPQLAANPVAKDRFLREARAAARVEHDNIVPILEVGEDRGIPFMAMPLLRGRTLDERLGEGTPNLDEALAIARGTVDGLAAAHDRGLIHRDIKPSNLWLETNDDGSFRRVRLLDFGLARQETDADRVTKSGTILGTPAYMAPEQARGEAVDARADLFSLGCVLYRMVTGQNAFRGSDTYSLLTSLAMDRPKAPSELNADIPHSLSHLIMGLLEKDAKRRPASARVVRDRLAEVASAVPASAPRRGRAMPIAAIALSLIGLVGVLFGGTIVRIATNKGELVVEVNDDNVEIVVKQDGAVVVDKTKNRRFVLTATDGEIEFLDPDTGVTTQTKTFRLTRGGVDRVVATMGAKPNGVAAKPGDPVRILAEWTLARGGVLGIRGTSGETKRIADLPREPFDIWKLELGKATDADMTELGKYWRNMPVTKGRQLFLSGIVTDQGLLQLAGLNIQQLSIARFPVTERGLAVLGTIDGLQSLAIGSANLGKCNLESIVRLPELTSLNLNSNNLGDTGLKALATMPKLTYLSLTDERVTDAGVAALADHPSLGAITIYDDRRLLTDVACQHLARMKNLRTLTLVAYGLTDQGAKELSAGKIESLRLESSKFTDATLTHLAGMKSLTSLDIEFNKQFTPGAIQKLAVALPACRITWHGGTIEPTASPAPAPLTTEQRKSLEAILARGGYISIPRPGLPAQYIQKGQTLPADAGAPEFIGIAMLDTDTPATILGILEEVPPGLKTLNMHDMPFTGADLEKLVAMPNLEKLESLSILSWNLRDDDLRHLRKLTKLKSVSVNFTPTITAAGIAHLKGLPLEVLSFQECPVDDSAIDTILSFRDLQQLGILNTK